MPVAQQQPALTLAPTASPPTAPRPTAASPPTLSAPTLIPAPRYDLVLVVGKLLDGTGGTPLEDAVVAIRDRRIAGVGRAGELTVAPDTPTRDVRGNTLLPGFIDAHVHTDGLAADDLKGWPRADVTTIRDLGGPREMMLARGGEVSASGDPELPRLLVGGPIITVPGGHPIPVYGLSDEVLTVDDAEDARAKVRALIDAGADVVKIAVSGRTDVRWPELSNDEIRAIAEVARERGVRVAARWRVASRTPRTCRATAFLTI
jgi:imidazolonepropionase-like amidohydrolase